MITLLTGRPGAGKTQELVRLLLEASAKGDRPVFAAGIDGLTPGLATDLADPTQWNQPGVLPDHSLVFVDEAWKWFGHLHNATHQRTPEHVLALAEHRHRGIDFVFTAQGVIQLYPFVRPLIEKHVHFTNRFSTGVLETTTWEGVCDDPTSAAKRASGITAVTRLNKSVFSHYKSASVHTHKARIPLRVFALPVLIVGAIGAIGFTVYLLRSHAPPSEATGADVSAPGPDSPSVKIATARDYIEQHTPLIQSLPWTRPATINRPALSNPEVYCMASQAGEDAAGNHAPATCHCLTEQGTRYALPDAECLTIASNGVYNPQRAPQPPSEARQAGDTTRVPKGTPAALSHGDAPDPDHTVAPADQQNTAT